MNASLNNSARFMTLRFHVRWRPTIVSSWVFRRLGSAACSEIHRYLWIFSRVHSIILFLSGGRLMEPSASLFSLHILLVDPRAYERPALIHILREIYTVTVVLTGEEAVQICRQDQPSLVIVD